MPKSDRGQSTSKANIDYDTKNFFTNKVPPEFNELDHLSFLELQGVGYPSN